MRLIGISVTCLSLAACSNQHGQNGSAQPEPEDPQHICDPGRSTSCTCTNGDSGSQTCSDDGSRWQQCTCEPDIALPQGEGEGEIGPECLDDDGCDLGKICILEVCEPEIAIDLWSNVLVCILNQRHDLRCFEGPDWLPEGFEESVDGLALIDSAMCKLDREGALVCAAEDPRADLGRLDAPEGVFTQIAGKDDYACAIRKDDLTVHCWGESDQEGWVLPNPQGQFTQVAVFGYGCGIRAQDGSVQCWLPEESDLEPIGIPQEGRFITLDMFGPGGCAVRDDYAVGCWHSTAGHNWDRPPGDEVIQVSMGVFHSCLLYKTGEVACWGGDDPPPDLPLASKISSGWGATCALTLDGKIACWGFEADIPDLPEHLDALRD